MNKLKNPRFYSSFTGTALFLFGFFGFAFPNYFNVPGGYLFAALVLGFWGIIVGVTKK